MAVKKKTTDDKEKDPILEQKGSDEPKAPNMSADEVKAFNESGDPRKEEKDTVSEDTPQPKIDNSKLVEVYLQDEIHDFGMSLVREVMSGKIKSGEYNVEADVRKRAAELAHKLVENLK